MPDWIVYGGVAWLTLVLLIIVALAFVDLWLDRRERRIPKCPLFDLATERARRKTDPFVATARKMREDYDDATLRRR